MKEILYRWLMAYLNTMGFILYGGGGKGQSAPAAPDYTGAATAQGAANRDIATQTTWANRPTINTPWGSQSWQSGSSTDPSTGLPVTNWTQNVNLNPDAQQALDDQQDITAGRSDTAKGLLGQVDAATKTPFDWGSMPEVGDLGTSQKSAFDRMAASLQPGRTQQDEALNTRLANMGLPMNSEAYNRAKMNQQNTWTQEDKSLLAQSGSEGRLDMGAQQARRTQAISEEAQKRGMSLNELNALLTGQQVQMPTGMSAAPNSTTNPWQAPNLTGAANSQGQYALGAQQNNQNGGFNWGSAVGGTASLAAAFI